MDIVFLAIVVAVAGILAFALHWWRVRWLMQELVAMERERKQLAAAIAAERVQIKKTVKDAIDALTSPRWISMDGLAARKILDEFLEQYAEGSEQ